MSEIRLIDANDFYNQEFERCGHCEPVIGTYSSNNILLGDCLSGCPIIDPETLPIVKELKAKLAKYENKNSKLTPLQVEELRVLKREGFHYLVRDKNCDSLYAFGGKPLKINTAEIWFTSELSAESCTKLIELTELERYDFIKWEDTEPVKIDDLLKEL